MYIKAEFTNVMNTWIKFGFVPPSTLVEYQAKWYLVKHNL